jgi:hypothetical protein
MVRGRVGPWNPLTGQEGLAGQAAKRGVEARPFKASSRGRALIRLKMLCRGTVFLVNA